MSWIVAAFTYLAGINAATFAAFAFDKRAAQSGTWRVRERTLLSLAAAGGTVGAFVGQEVLRHKTAKQPFRTYLVLIAAGQVVGIALLVWVAAT